MSWEEYQAAPEQIDSEAKAALRLTSIVGRALDKLVVLARQEDASQASSGARQAQGWLTSRTAGDAAH